MKLPCSLRGGGQMDACLQEAKENLNRWKGGVGVAGMCKGQRCPSKIPTQRRREG